MSELRAIVNQLGLTTASDGDAVLGRAEVFPEICVPGTATLRTSVLATWADILTGAIAGRALDPRIPLTLDLEVQVQQPAQVGTIITAEATVTKLGRSVVVCEAWFRDEATRAPIAMSFASFIASPNPEHVFVGGFPDMASLIKDTGRITMPLAERAGCRVVEPGTAEVPHQPDGLNASGAIQGGIVALAAEEAASSLASEPVVLHSLAVRYLRQFTVGPAVAVATGTSDVSVVRLTDRGNDRLGAVATARARPVESATVQFRKA